MKVNENQDLSKIIKLLDTIRDIRKVMRTHFQKKMKEHDIDVTIEMLEVLYILWAKDSINQQEIVDKTNRNKASITSLIDNMTRRKLVQRNADPNDRRNNLVALTPEGEKYQKKLKPLLEEFYTSFQVDISSKDMHSTLSVLEKIYQKLTE